MNNIYKNINYWYHYYLIKGKQREGQALFNAIYKMDTEYGNEIRGSELDTFYDDSRCDKLWEIIYKKYN